jgi:two-component system sensor histidine kinase KdpD
MHEYADMGTHALPLELSESFETTPASVRRGHGAMELWKSCAMIERLYTFIQRATQLDLHREPGGPLAILIRETFALEAVAIFDADLHTVCQAGEWVAEVDNVVRNVYFFASTSEDAETGLIRRPLLIGDLPVGALLLRGTLDPGMSDAIASLVAITFDRYHSHTNMSRTESARQTEQMRTTVLDNLAHAYKTPLTAIRAAGTGLKEMGRLTGAQEEMVDLINDQTRALNELTSRLLKTARLEAHELQLRKEPVAVASLIEDVVAGFRSKLARASLSIVMPREDISLCCDRELVVALLTQYLDNAVKYSATDSPITIRVAEQPGEIVFSVHNLGPVIPSTDSQRIFERYFRCPASAGNVSGSGIGLSVAKRAAQAHGGDVWVISSHEHGTTFFSSLMVNTNGDTVHG